MGGLRHVGTRGWCLDEVASAGRENLDPVHVARYDAKEDAGAAAEVALLESLGLGAASTVVDLGAGTGQFAAAVASRCARVVAVDVSPVMTEHRRRAAVTPTVEHVQAGFLTYEHEGAPADFVYSRYALHHLPDFWKAVALARIHAMLRPGGVLRLSDIVYGFAPGEADEALEAWMTSGGEDVGTQWTREELEEHVRDEDSTFTWLLEPMLSRAGFAIEDAQYSPDRIFAHYVCRAGI